MKFTIKLIILTSCFLFLGFERKNFSTYKNFKELAISITNKGDSSDNNLFIELKNAYQKVANSLIKEKNSRRAREESFNVMGKKVQELEQMLFNIERQLKRIPAIDGGDSSFHAILQTQLKEQLKGN